MEIKFVDLDSPEYLSFCDLRYRVFFQDRGFPKDILFDEDESISHYAVVVKAETQRVVAGGRLTPRDTDPYRLSQMVVDPAYQGQGWGRSIMTMLIEKAVDLRASVLVLNARTSAVGFYERFGFAVVSDVVLSKTGTPHVIMQKTVNL